MKSKKSQGAIEFMIILSFIFVVLALVMYVTGQYLIDVRNDEQKQQVENFAEKINNELKILSKVEPGYIREIELHQKYYNITLIPSKIDGSPVLLKIDDLYNNKSYYFDLIGNYAIGNGNFNISKRTSVNEQGINTTILRFEKRKQEENIGIVLVKE